MEEASTGVKLFCSYAHQDEKWLRKLEIHLSLLKQQGLISLWHDRLIVPGTNWAKVIDTHLETASVILLLVSADFLASDYCYSVEMQYTLKRHEAGEARVIPLLVRPVDWKDAPFAHLQPLPTDAKPLSIWPDEDLALTDVIAGIRHVLEDLPRLSASVPRAALPAIWNIPYRRNPFFTGRDEMLSRIHIQLQAGQVTMLSQPQAINGLGGIGKTQIAIEYAYRHHQEYQAVLWAHAETQETLISSFSTIAMLLNLPEQVTPDIEVTIQAIKTWLQTHKSWLLILDNADDVALAHDFLPLSFDGHVLLTTRAQSVGKAANHLDIGILSTEHGVLFLLHRAGLLAPDALVEQVPSGEREQARAICHELGGLPLALDQAGAYIEKTGCSLADYARLYQQRRKELLEQRGGPVKDDHPASVVATLSLSFQKVTEKNPAAADLLRLCVFLAPDAIPLEIFTRGADQVESTFEPVFTDAFLLDQAIGVLRAYSLVQRDPATQTLSIHRLVQVVIQDSMTEQEQTQWRQRAILVLNTVFPQEIDDKWEQCARLISHIMMHAIDCKDDIGGQELVELLEKAAVYSDKRGQYKQSEQLYEQVLRIQERIGNIEDSLLVNIFRGLADTYYRLAKFKQAEHVCEQALRIQERIGGAPDAFILNTLANIYSRLGKHEQAELLYTQALSILEQAGGLDAPDKAFPLNNLAYLYLTQKKYEQARLLYEQAIRIREQGLGPEHPRMSYLLQGLAIIFYEEGKYEQAEPLYRRAIHLREQWGSDHPEVAELLDDLANVYLEQGKYEQAELLYKRALRIKEQHLGSEHIYIALTLQYLANLYFKQGKYEQAKALFERVLHIEEQVNGLEASSAAFALNDLANLYYNQRKYEQAEPLYERALRIREQRDGPDHLDTAIALDNLAITYVEQKKYQQAEPLFKRALHIWEQTKGFDAPEVTSRLFNLSYLYLKQGKDEQAELLFKRAIALDPNFAVAYLDRGYVYLHLRKTEHACADFATYADIQQGDVNAQWMTIFASFDKRHPGPEIADRLEMIAKLDPQSYEAYTCRGVALELRGKPQEGLIELEQALHRDAESEDALFWKGMLCASLGRSTEAIESIEQALHDGLPPILLTPLFWLERDIPHFYREYAQPLLKRYELL